MTTPSGTISLNDVNVELGLAGTTTISMNQTNVRTLAGVPSGAISMNDLRGKSNRVNAQLTISANTTNYTLGTSKVTGYVAGKTDVTLTINSNIFVYSTSTGSYALTVDTTWAAGDTVTIVNNGTILGMGGNGGGGGKFGNGGGGSSGGPALLVQRATSINNVNRIAGGGGGGGGGGQGYTPYYDGGELYYEPTGGGGGGGGIGGGSGGAGGVDGNIPFSGAPGSAGTLTSAGGGGQVNAVGGNGGTYGTAGGSGAPGSSGYSGGGGGGGGAAVVGNSYITWIATGTRNGSIS